MKRVLLRTNAFIHAAKKFAKKNPQLAQELPSVLALLTSDAFDRKLKTHTLKGKLEHSWACSIGYEMRIVFSFVQHEGQEAILLETLGTHDEVY